MSLIPAKLAVRRVSYSLAIVTLAAIAIALRLSAGSGDLWLDEIWSLQLVQQVDSPWDVVTDLKHDNNHLLNSLLIYLIGPEQPDFSYRLPAILAGVAAIAVVGWIAASNGRAELTITLLVMSFSYLLVHYSSEARGYSMAILFALLAYKSLLRFRESPGRCWTVVFNVSAVLGLITHLSFLYVYAAAFLWSLISTPVERAQRPEWLSRLLQLHAIPLLTAVTLYWMLVRGMELGGGPSYTPAGLLTKLGSLMLGGPTDGFGALITASISAVAVVVSIVIAVLRRRPDWPFLLLVVAFPLGYLLIAQPPFMFVRYFLLSIVFALMAICRELASCWNEGLRRRVLIGGCCLLFVVGNAFHIQQLLEHRRGSYSLALHTMSNGTGQPLISIGGDHDHGLRKLIEYHSPDPPLATMQYFDTDSWPDNGVDWLILHEPKDASQGPRELSSQYAVAGQDYRLFKVFDAAILSGWRWHCYQKVAASTLSWENLEPSSPIRTMTSK